MVDRLGGRGGLPKRAADLDPPTLSRLLGRDVRSVSVLGGTSGTTDRARLAVAGEGLPASVFVKMAATDTGTRLFGGLARLGEVEVGFYRDIRPGLSIEAPGLVAASFDGGTGRFAIVLEDLVARGATFVDTLTPLTLDGAAAALTTLAGLHGATHALENPPAWLGTNAGDPLLPLVSASLGRLGRRVQERDRSLFAGEGKWLLDSYGRYASLLDAGPQCVLHGDPHPGNIYLLEDRVGLLDWQAVRRGNPLRDATYFMVLGLASAVRRESERDLLDHFRGVLEAAGGPRFTADEAWLGYRRMAAYAYVAATFTYGLGGLQGDDIADEGLRRAASAVDDLDTAEALGRWAGR